MKKIKTKDDKEFIITNVTISYKDFIIGTELLKKGFANLWKLRMSDWVS